MSYWQILKPQAGQNLIVNPSFENGTTTGWTAIYGFLAISSSWQFRGSKSLRITPLSGDPYDGVYYTVTIPTYDNYTFSVYGYFPNGVPYRIRFADTSGNTIGTAQTFTGAGGQYQRVSITSLVPAATTRLYVEKNNSSSGTAFYLDAVQLENSSIVTTYIDGDEPGCTWDGGRWNSTSTRSINTTAGGIWQDFEDDLGIIPLEMQGVGMPPLDNVATPYALLPGARFERSLARSRVFTIVCLIPGSTWVNFHNLREILIRAVQPDQTTQQQPVYLRYTGSSQPQIIAAHYDGGLEFAQPSGFAETVPLRFVAHDPFWYEERHYAIEFAPSPSVLTITNLGAMTSDGAWTSFSSNITGAVDAILPLNDGTIVIGGNFTNAGGVLTADYIARYDPQTQTWADIGTAGANGRVRALTLYNGQLIAAGDFTNIGATPANRIAAYDFSTDTWAAFGTGANSTVYALGTADSTLIATGAFTSINGVAANRIAHYDGTAWSAIGTGLNGNGLTIATVGITSAGLPLYYVGGSFTTAAGTTVNRVTYYNGTTFVAMGTTGVNGTVNALALTSDGQLYVGGAFTSAGGVTASYIALWNGAGWQALSSGGPSSSVVALTVDRNNRVFVAASSATPFTGQPGVVAIYQQGAWLPTYHTNIASTTITTMVVTNDRTWYIGSSGTTTAGYGDRVEFKYSGTAPAAGWAFIDSYGLHNFVRESGLQITGASLDVIAYSEEGKQRIVLSADNTTRATQYLHPGARFDALTIMPGVENNIGGYDRSQIILYWRPRNWSLDV